MLAYAADAVYLTPPPNMIRALAGRLFMPPKTQTALWKNLTPPFLCGAPKWCAAAAKRIWGMFLPMVRRQADAVIA